MHDEQFTGPEIEEGRIPAILGYIGPLCFIPLTKTTNSFAQKHGKQGLILFLAELLAGLFLTPLGAMAWKLLLLGCIVSAFIGAFQAWGDKGFRVPFLDMFIQKFK
jgi:uncharacterized membrane protein